MKVNPVIITSINFGYIPLVQNLRHSLDQIGLLSQLRIFAYGKMCQHKLTKLGIQSYLVDTDYPVDCAVSFRKRDWKYLTYQKIKVLQTGLEMFEGFLYTDPDVVFQRDVFPFLQTLPEGFDIYGQRDLLPAHAICTGFIYINRNPTTQELFSISWDDYQKETGIGDQRYINKNRDIVKLYGLPEELFLGGVWFCKGPRYNLTPEILKNAYIAHYNFTSCMLEKYLRMKKNKHIFVRPSLWESIGIYINGQLIFAERRMKDKNWAKKLVDQICRPYYILKTSIKKISSRKTCR